MTVKLDCEHHFRTSNLHSTNDNNVQNSHSWILFIKRYIHRNKHQNTNNRSLISSLYFVLVVRSLETTSFNPQQCQNKSIIGTYCNISRSICDIFQSSCLSGEECHENAQVKFGFGCRCTTSNCPWICTQQCINGGQCIGQGKNSSGRCLKGWMGDHCEQRNNSCQYHKCENGGQCLIVADEPVCQCLGDNFYSGERCQYRQTKLVVFETLSKSFSWLAIIIFYSFGLFIVLMGFLKYGLHINVTAKKSKEIQHEKHKTKKRKRRSIVQKFIYVNNPWAANVQR